MIKQHFYNKPNTSRISPSDNFFKHSACDSWQAFKLILYKVTEITIAIIVRILGHLDIQSI